MKHLVDYQKTMLNSGFNIIVILQGEAEKVFKGFLTDIKTSETMGDTFEMLITDYKNQRANYKSLIDGQFERLKKQWSS